jgi:FkbM family methyltransferase
MLSKKVTKQIKQILINLRIWNLIKKIQNKDVGEPLNKNLMVEGKEFYSRFISSNDLVFDVGANFGNRVAIFLAIEAKVVAIEPQDKCVKYLKATYKDLLIENVGLGAKKEMKTFYEADNSVLSTFSDEYIEKVENTRHKTSIWKKSTQIQIVTLDELIAKYGNPEFIKIDVEGYEYEVLSGLNQKSGVISFEYNVPELINEVLNCIEKLYSLGYNEFNYSVGESMKLYHQDWLDYNSFVTIVNENTFLKSTFGDVYAK